MLKGLGEAEIGQGQVQHNIGGGKGYSGEGSAGRRYKVPATEADWDMEGKPRTMA